LAAKGSSKIAVIRPASPRTIWAAEISRRSEKQILFLRKSFAGSAHGSVHTKKFSRKQVFVGPRAKKILRASCWKSLRFAGRKFSCAFRGCDSRRKQL